MTGTTFAATVVAFGEQLYNQVWMEASATAHVEDPSRPTYGAGGLGWPLQSFRVTDAAIGIYAPARSLLLSAPKPDSAGMGEHASSRELALSAIDDLRRWLTCTDAEVATLVQIAPRSIPNWRNRGNDPYPATVRALFETHSLIAALVRAIGLVNTRVWLRSANDADTTPLERLGRGEHDAVVRAAWPLLFSGAPAAVVDLEAHEDAPKAAHDPSLFAGRARKVRRAHQ